MDISGQRRQQPRARMVSFTVADLLATDGLRLTVHAGHAQLGNEVAVAHVSELPTAPALLNERELLMTSGIVLDDSEEAWNGYVTALAARKAAGLALGVGPNLPYRTVPARLIAAADRRGVPLLEIPPDTSFIEVARAVIGARAAIDQGALEESFALQHELSRVAAGEGGLAGLTRAWGVATGEQVLVLDRRGRQLASSVQFTPEATAVICAAVPTIPSRVESFLPIHTPAGEALVSAIGTTRHAGYLARLNASSALGRRTVPTLVSLLSIEFERRWLVDEPARRARSQQLTRLLGADDNNRAAAQLRAVGIYAETVQAVAVQASSNDRAEEILADLTIALGNGLVRRRDHLVEALAFHDPRDALTTLGLSSAVGLGAPVAPGQAARSLRQAHAALATSVRSGAIVEYIDGRAHDFLLQIADTAYLREFADAVLSPIDAADPSNTLVETLHGWLAEGGSIDGCSQRLGVHRHTVRNRMHRITQLLGRSIDTVDAQTELWLALKARGLREDT